MNCTSCRYELSLCLDGRLPSGRRALVMQHVAACEVCSTFWDELQVAQRLTLQLPKHRVSDGFRDELWQRIRAGEGTPEAVFREPVPLLVKARYALTGAAAAAAVLLLGMWLRGDGPRGGAPDTGGPAPESIVIADRAPAPQQREQEVRSRIAEHRLVVDQSPMFSAAQPLTADLVAVEAAKQFEQRFDAANRALAEIESEGHASDAAVLRILDHASEMRGFGELLLDLREQNRVVFLDSGVDADLQVTVNLLGQGKLQKRNLDTVHAVVAPALRNRRLARLARTISVVPTLDPRDDQDVLVRLNTRRPEIFPKLFFVLGHDARMGEDLGSWRPGSMFALEDQCGISWVSPRSEVEAADTMLRFLRSSGSGPGAPVEVQIQIRSGSSGK
jgi:hypothetical protein